MNSLVQIIASSQEELLVTNPYFIPDSSIVRILKIAALRGVTIKLLVPDISDSKLVNAAAESNYQELLELGIEIYRYTKGFIHAKTIVADRRLSVVGTANLDYRSFDLNFEVNGIVYDQELASELACEFEQDLKEARKMTLKEWQNRGFIKILKERTARLFSPLL
jgi:cardiolipin synthase